MHNVLMHDSVKKSHVHTMFDHTKRNGCAPFVCYLPNIQPGSNLKTSLECPYLRA